MRIEAGSAINPTGNFVGMLCTGLPYGEKPRLVLIHLASEAVRTGAPVIDVDHTMTSFARSLGLDTNGRQLRGLKEQLARLASATIRMGVVEDGRAVQVNTQIVAAFDLWFPKQPDQRVLWPSTVRLSEVFSRALGKPAVPAGPPGHRWPYRPRRWRHGRWPGVNWRAICTGFRQTKPQLITWLALYEQFGQGFARLRDFRRNFLQTLHQVHAAYPQAQIDADEVGLATVAESAAGAPALRPVPAQQECGNPSRKPRSVGRAPNLNQSRSRQGRTRATGRRCPYSKSLKCLTVVTVSVSRFGTRCADHGHLVAPRSHGSVAPQHCPERDGLFSGLVTS